MSKNSQAQAQAQAKAELTQAVHNKIQSMSIVDVMLSAVPSLTAKDEDGNDVALPVMVGQKQLTNDTMRIVTVTARTIAKFEKESTTALSIELGKVTKELAKAEGFTSVKRFCATALPHLSDSRIWELYTVGRLFGNPDTHTWKNPIPDKRLSQTLRLSQRHFAKLRNLMKQLKPTYRQGLRSL